MNSIVDCVIGSGIIVFGILLIRKWAMEKISRKLQYFLWLSLPIYLLLSPFFSIKIPVSVEVLPVTKYIDATDDNIEIPYTQDEALPYHEDASGKPQVIDQNKSDRGEQSKNIIIQEQVSDINGASIHLEERWQLFRIIISFILLTFFVVTNVIFIVRLRSNRLFYKAVSLDDMLNEYPGFSQGAGRNYYNFLYHNRHRARLKIYLTNNSNAPFLFGKNIYLSQNMIENSEQMHYIILHEFCHFMHGDLFWNILKYFCCALYWFDPFVWIASYYMGRDCELACDESVIHMVGIKNQKVYGLTLLQLIIDKKNGIGFTIGTAMKGRKSLMKERILFISRTFSKNKRVALGSLIIAFLLTGCALIRPYTYVQADNITNDDRQSLAKALNSSAKVQGDFSTIVLSKMMQTKNETGFFDQYLIENNCYNPIKSDGAILYYGTAECLQCTNLKTGKITQLASGNIKPAFLTEDYLYYIKYPTPPSDDAGIGRFNLVTQENEFIIPWTDELWSCGNVLIEDNCIYLEIGNTCEAYLLKDNGIMKLDETQNQIQNEIGQFDLSEDELSGINFGFINSIMDYSVFVVLDGRNNELHIYDTNSKKQLMKKNCLGNVLICNKGIVYMTLDGDVILNSWAHMENEQILFSAIETGYFVNYGTYNDTGLYVFREKGNSVECIHITWEGEKEKIMSIPDVDMAIKLNFSAFSDFVAYYQGGKIRYRQLTNE